MSEDRGRKAERIEGGNIRQMAQGARHRAGSIVHGD
jgi:hypothetical protein